MGLFGGVSFRPDQDIPDLSGRVILVTGGNSGLGKETILQLAQHNPSKIYMGARSPDKAAAAIAEIKKIVPKANILPLRVDISSFKSIKAAAQTFSSENDRLDILINNAGILGVPPGLTEDGYEVQFGTNHIGPAFLTKLLLPVLGKTAAKPDSDVRIVNVSSTLHTWSPKTGIPLDKMQTKLEDVDSMALYGMTKLANIYHAQELAKRYPKITSSSIHPGLVRTNLGDDHMKQTRPWLTFLLTIPGRLISVDSATGAHNQLWASVASKEKVVSGAYYEPVAKEVKKNLINDKAAAEELWNWTEKVISN